MTPPGEDAADRHRFEVVDSAVHYRGAIVNLRVDTVTMPGGGHADREIVEHRGAVAVLALDEDDRVLVIDQYRHALGRRMLQLPAGLLDVAGEDPVAAAERELVEETGWTAAHFAVLVDLAVSPGFTDELLRVYLATGLRPVDRPAPADEEADMRSTWVGLDTLVAQALGGELYDATAVAAVTALVAARSLGTELRAADASAPLWPTAFDARAQTGRP